MEISQLIPMGLMLLSFSSNYENQSPFKTYTVTIKESNTIKDYSSLVYGNGEYKWRTYTPNSNNGGWTYSTIVESSWLPDDACWEPVEGNDMGEWNDCSMYNDPATEATQFLEGNKKYWKANTEAMYDELTTGVDGIYRLDTKLGDVFSTDIGEKILENAKKLKPAIKNMGLQIAAAEIGKTYLSGNTGCYALNYGYGSALETVCNKVGEQFQSIAGQIQHIGGYSDRYYNTRHPGSSMVYHWTLDSDQSDVTDGDPYFISGQSNRMKESGINHQLTIISSSQGEYHDVAFRL